MTDNTPANDDPVVPTTKPLTDEQRAKRYDELRRRQQMSRIFAQCNNPDISVRWVRKDDSNDISYHEWMGFKVAVEPDPNAPKDKRRFNTAVPCNEEGKYVVGDVILMEIPRDDYEFYLSECTKRSTEMVDAGKDNFITEAQRMDVPVFERDKAGNKQTAIPRARR